MDGICRATGALGAALLQSDVRTPDVPVTESARDLFAFYFRHGWHKRDFRARGVPLILSGVPVFTDQDIATPEDMRTEPFYNECVFALGIHWSAVVGFRADSDYWALSLQRTTEQGPFEQEETRLLARLSPHLTSIATLSSAVGRIALSSSMNALGAVLQPAIAVDRLGSVLDANAAMEQLWDENIRVWNKRLHLADPHARRRFEKLIQQLMTASDDAGLTGSEPIVVKRRERSPIVLRVLAVPSAARSPFLGARAILTFAPVEPRSRPAVSLLKTAFGLTPAEARVAAALAHGSTLQGVADELGISRETARDQLKSVFLKTDTHRQSQLVALLARL
jgi:DNA-binding CsgD family transcriptional regulator